MGTLCFYDIVGCLVRRRRIPRLVRAAHLLGLIVLGGVLTFLSHWGWLSPDGLIRNFIMALVLIVAWKVIPEDYDVAQERPNWLHKLALAGLTILVFFMPGFVILFLFIAINYLSAWTHHTMMPIRMLKLFGAYSIAAAVLSVMLVPRPDSTA